MRTRSQAKAAMAANISGAGNGRVGVKRKAKDTPTVAAAQAATGQSLVGNFGLEVDADAVMGAAAVEGRAQVEENDMVMGNGMVLGNAAMMDAGTVGGVPVMSDLLYETESAGMIEMEVDGDGSHVSIRLSNDGDGTEGKMGFEPGGLQSKVELEGAAEGAELSNCSDPHHIESGPNNSGRFVRYRLPRLDNGKFRVSDLVWSKMEGYPWWPGEIFDPSDASELALKHQIEGNYLVIYFGDGTFSWRDESQLKPFMANYAQMEKECTSDDCINAVNNALEELSRRILSGMSCPCLPDELSDSGMSYLVENHGLKDGVICCTANKAGILKCFDPENLLQYVKSLALFPGQGGDLLELVVACSQLTSFYRSKGCPELASFQAYNGLDVMDASSTINVTMEEDVQKVMHSDHDTSETCGGSPKRKPENQIELMEKKETYNPISSDIYNEFDDWHSRRLESSFKTGECKLQATSQLTGLSSIEKPQNERTQNGKNDTSCYESGDELTVLKRAKWIHINENDSAEPKEFLPQLCSVAIEPLNKNICSSRIISYFSYYKNYVVTASTEVSITGNDTPRRGRTMNVDAPEVERTDHMQDSYWSGLSLQNDPIHSLDMTCSITMPKRKRKLSQEKCVPLPQHPQPATWAPKKEMHVMERSILHFDAKFSGELKPTALVLSFGRSAALPSELDLIKMFCRYGPLKETETEVHKDTNTAKVVFKKRVDAERGFSVVGNYSTFGPSLRSYRLVNMPFSLSA